MLISKCPALWRGREGTVLDFRKLLSNYVAVHTELHTGTELLRLMLSSKSPVTKIFMFHLHYLALRLLPWIHRLNLVLIVKTGVFYSRAVDTRVLEATVWAIGPPRCIMRNCLSGIAFSTWSENFSNPFLSSREQGKDTNKGRGREDFRLEDSGSQVIDH